MPPGWPTIQALGCLLKCLSFCLFGAMAWDFGSRQEEISVRREFVFTVWHGKLKSDFTCCQRNSGRQKNMGFP